MTLALTRLDSELDLVGFLQKLITIESCDPPGEELEIAQLVYNKLLAFGIEAEIDEFMPGRANVLGRIRGSGLKPSLVLSSHMDTVPPGATPWSFPPFSGAIQDGRILGRGASDMKSALAAMIWTGATLALRAKPLAGDIILAFTGGESSNCLGAQRFVEQGLKSEIGAFLCGEPSSLNVIVVEKAALWLRAEARGRVGHVSGDPGVNAIWLMADYIGQLGTVSLACPPHPLLDPATLRVGRISGGSAVNITPDACVAEIDVRLPPRVSPELIIEQLRAHAPDGVTIELIDFKPAVESSPDSPFVKVCIDACRRVTQRTPQVKGVSYYSDAAVLLTGLDVPFAIVGPGDLGMSGQPDESVSIDNVKAAAQVYQRVAEEWLS